jgi:hypothetical protein
MDPPHSWSKVKPFSRGFQEATKSFTVETLVSGGENPRQEVRQAGHLSIVR